METEREFTVEELEDKKLYEAAVLVAYGKRDYKKVGELFKNGINYFLEREERESAEELKQMRREFVDKKKKEFSDYAEKMKEENREYWKNWFLGESKDTGEMVEELNEYVLNLKKIIGARCQIQGVSEVSPDMAFRGF